VKRLRFVIVQGKDVQERECYLMAAIPTVVVQTGPKIIGQRQLNMNMVPCRLEWVDTDEFGKETVHPIILEDIRPPVVMPQVPKPTVPPTGKLDG